MLTQEIQVRHIAETTYDLRSDVWDNRRYVEAYHETLTADTLSDAITQTESTMSDMGYKARTPWVEYEDNGRCARNIFRAETV